MAQTPQNFTDMFKNLGEQLKIPSLDVSKIMEHHQKNLEAMTKSWQAMASGATEIANKQRASFEEEAKEGPGTVTDDKPRGSPQAETAKYNAIRKNARKADDATHAPD